MVKKTIIIFIIALWASCWSYDFYHVGLAVSGVILSYWIACLFNHLWIRLSVLFLSSGALIQIGVLARRAFLEKGLWQVISDNPSINVVGDIVHGYRSIVMSFYASIDALVRAVGWGDYSYLDLLNLRFVVAAWLLVGFSIYFWRIKDKK